MINREFLKTNPSIMSCENDNKAFNTAPAKGKRWFALCVRSCERARGNDSTLKNFLVLHLQSLPINHVTVSGPTIHPSVLHKLVLCWFICNVSKIPGRRKGVP